MATEAWVEIDATTMAHYIVSAQLEALRTAALGVGQSDPLDQIIPDVVRTVRSYIEGCSKNTLSAVPNTVPQSLVAETCWLVAEAMQTRIPSFSLSESQQKAADNARRLLVKVAACEIPVAQPPNASASVVGTAIPVRVTYEKRQTTRSQLDGL